MENEIRKANNAGLVTATGAAAGDLLHTIPIGRTVKLKKIMANAAVPGTLSFGTLNRIPGAPIFAAMLPLLAVIPGDNEWLETEIPGVEWVNDTTIDATGVLGRTGDIRVVAAAGVVIRLEVAEKGA